MTVFFQNAGQDAQSSLPTGTHAQFVDAVHDGTALDWAPAPITWNGFPKALIASSGSFGAALPAAEQLFDFKLDGRTVKMRPQDEYLEWHPSLDAEGKILGVDFTCEGPEYWESLAHGYPDQVQLPDGAPAANGSMDTVTALYRKHISPDVQTADLLSAGSYDPWNKWNTELGAMHLTHISNSLNAEVFLAGDATVLREQGGVVLTDDDALIKCAMYGEPARSSDPTIGGAVNSLARTGALVSLLNPVGLYIDSLDTSGWSKPDGSPVGNYWTIVRGSADYILRARYEVPKSEGFTVSDIKIGGEPIAYSGQIAQKITMRLTGISAEAGQHKTPAVGCKMPKTPAVGGVQAPKLRLLLPTE
jgi:hypothetical protein